MKRAEHSVDELQGSGGAAPAGSAALAELLIAGARGFFLKIQGILVQKRIRAVKMTKSDRTNLMRRTYLPKH